MTTISNGGTATIGERSSILACLSTRRHPGLMVSRLSSPRYATSPNPTKKEDHSCEARQQQEARERPRKLAHARPPLLQCKNHHFQESVLVGGHATCSDGRCFLALQYPTPQRACEVLRSGRVAGILLARGCDLASSNDVRGKVNLNFRIAAIRRKRDESGKATVSAFIQASPTINVAIQDGSVLLCREWASLVQTLAFVIRQLCRKNCGLS